ncbi:hypothetical protein U8607_02490 [Methylobacterium durans]|uniref:hypothetical protein n=1 Tax=Methylobacterium durans TaxID=2202825 RepID=UPI002B0037B7|nr:hypothetical protein [Methylobacterium durans]MEA1830939.1 hypothetical protein [Methylobacterium durans]
MKALLLSPYLQIAIVMGGSTSILSGMRFGEIGSSILPNILGFTIGAMAIVLSLATSQFFIFLAQGGEPRSFFMQLIANFLHYISLQATTIVVCVFEKQFGGIFLNFVASVMFIFSVLTPIAIGAQLFQMARLYNAHASLKDDGPQ